MINLKELKVEDFNFEIRGDEIRQMGKFILFPVNVLFKSNGEPAFSQTVQINAKFHEQLKGEENYQSSLTKILKARIEPEILKFIHDDDGIKVQEKVSLIALGKIPL